MRLIIARGTRQCTVEKDEMNAPFSAKAMFHRVKFASSGLILVFLATQPYAVGMVGCVHCAVDFDSITVVSLRRGQNIASRRLKGECKGVCVRGKAGGGVVN